MTWRAGAAILEPMAGDAAENKARFERTVAECVVRFVPEVSLCAMRDAPDADLLHRDGHHVGLEIVSAIHQEYLDTDVRIRAAIDELRRQLGQRGVRVFLSARFDIAEVDAQTSLAARKAWQRDVLARVAALVQSIDRGCAEESALRKLGITLIVHLEWSPSTSLTVMPGRRWFSRSGARPVDVCLAKKHEKLRQYRRENGDHFQAYWLAITGYGAGVTDHGFSMLLEGRYATDYDRVFLVEEAGGAFVNAQDVTPPSDHSQSEWSARPAQNMDKRDSR